MEIISITEYESAREYKIGNTIYVVETRFNPVGEDLRNIIRRLIQKDVERAA